MKEKTYKEGIFTPWGQVLCFSHVASELPVPPSAEKLEWAKTPQPLSRKNAVTCCDRCRSEIQIDKNIAYEHEIVAILKDRGIDAYMAQTGGMNSACAIAVPEMPRSEDKVGVPDEMLVVYDPYGTDHYVMGIYSDCSPAEVEDAEMEFETLDGLLAWIDANPDKVAHLEIEPAEKSLDQAMNEAKGKTVERSAGCESKPPPKKDFER